VQRQLTGGSTNTICLKQAYGGTLTCTDSAPVSLISVRNITIHDDGCKFPGDTVRFSANFGIQATAIPRYDIGIWFSLDGDQNNDGSLTGSCTASTPFFDSDGDFCGDMIKGQNPQYPRFTLEIVCRGNSNGWLMLPYCSSFRKATENSLCTVASEAEPIRPEGCKCDRFFFVDIPVPGSGGSGGGIGDPHFERYVRPDKLIHDNS
jgi:hypothetical protein